jgi:hypothetical protein
MKAQTLMPENFQDPDIGPFDAALIMINDEGDRSRRLSP